MEMLGEYSLSQIVSFFRRKTEQRDEFPAGVDDSLVKDVINRENHRRSVGDCRKQALADSQLHFGFRAVRESLVECRSRMTQLFGCSLRMRRKLFLGFAQHFGGLAALGHVP